MAAEQEDCLFSGCLATSSRSDLNWVMAWCLTKSIQTISQTDDERVKSINIFQLPFSKLCSLKQMWPGNIVPADALTPSVAMTTADTTSTLWQQVLASLKHKDNSMQDQDINPSDTSRLRPRSSLSTPNLYSVQYVTALCMAYSQWYKLP